METQFLDLGPEPSHFLLIIFELSIGLVKLIRHVLLLLTQHVHFLSFCFAIGLHFLKLLLQVLCNLDLAHFVCFMLLTQLFE